MAVQPNPRQQSPIVRLWYKGVARIIGIRVTCHWPDNTIHASDKALYLANHSSYLDIIILGAFLPPFFVAKADTADWPIFGFLIKLGRTLFISRKRSLLKQQMALFRQALKNGRSLLLFPEGTTSDGQTVLPFKSSLLHVLYETSELSDVGVVPVCLTYQTVNGLDFSDSTKDLVAWYADMELVPHLWQVFNRNRLRPGSMFYSRLLSVYFRMQKV